MSQARRELATDDALRAIAEPRRRAILREFLDDMWADSLDAARRIAEADRGIADDEPAASAG